MEAYDRLPPRLRTCLAYAALDWSTGRALDAILRGKSEDELIAQVHAYEKKYLGR
jgi:hypothetical protein